MGANAQVKMSSRTQYSRYLGDFRGVDFSSSPAMVAQNRFSYLKNMWKDYESGQGQAIETMPGYRVVLSALAGKGRIYSIHEYRDSLMVKCGTSLYFCKFDEHGNKMTVGNSGRAVANGLAEGAITGFVFNNDFWFLDGKEYYHYTYGESSCSTTTESAYIPTTYIDGEEYEQRNILTNRFKEKVFVGGKAVAGDKLDKSSEGLIFTKPADKESVLLSGCDGLDTATVIPDTALNGVERYPVSGVQNGEAFSSTNCRILSIPNGFNATENSFSGYRFLTTLIVRPKNEDLSVQSGVFSTGAFAGCTGLKNLYLNFEKDSAGKWNLSFDSDCFGISGDDCFDVNIYCNITLDALKTVEGYANLPLAIADDNSIMNVYEGVSYNGEIETGSVVYDITLFEPFTNISRVLYNGDPVDGTKLNWYYETKRDGGIISGIRVYTDPTVIAGDEFVIEGYGNYNKLSTAKQKNSSVYDANASYDASTADSALNVLRKCTVTAIFDGRVFFTGNPDLPNTVLYSARDLTSANNPAYIGVYNYFNDGVGDKRNTAMISTPSMLIVCKENTKQDGSCWYHVGQDTGYDLIPRVYPSTQGVAGIGCVGAATNFADDPVFLSTEGLMAIGKQTVNLERTVEHRSSNIDLKLKQCNLKGARMAEWKGYLVMLVDGQMFLADSRQLFQHDTGVTQYEWYYADDIGVYTGQTQMVSTTTGCIFAAVGGKTVDLTAPEYANRLTYSQNGGNSGIVYVNSDSESERYDNTELLATNAAILLDGVDTGLKFPVVQTDRGAYLATYVDQYSGGTFSPAECLCVMDDRLLLGTAHGEVLCFNTDLRGKTVWRAIRRPDGFTPAEDDTRVYANPSKDMIWTDEDDAPTVETPDGTYTVITTGAVSYLAERLEVEPDEIWQGFYNRNGREIMAVCETLCDSSAYPQIAKNTVRKSIVVRSKSMGSSEYSVFVRSNREQEWRECRRTSRMGSTLDLEFRNLSYLTSDIVISVVPDRLKRWQWQQFRFESAGYCKPFGLLDLFYRYENGGNIK